MQPKYEIAQVLEVLGSEISQLGLNSWQLRTLSAIKVCRTAALGGHVDLCDECGNISISYNSCRNRHCPKCQGNKREQWIQARQTELLPVPYFHLVFTLPAVLNSLAIHQPKLVYDTLFSATWDTLNTFGKNKGLKLGMVAVLHSWGQNLSLHPHLHCIVPGGGIDQNGRWNRIRQDGKFLFPVRALSKVFRAKYCQQLKRKAPGYYEPIRKDMWKSNWVVYAKRPFGSPNAVVEYLGRYTHKVAISNHRIKLVSENTVTFDYKDYRQGGVKKRMTLPILEFVRRFSLHILPKRFVKIRHFGFLSSTSKRLKLKQLQQSMKAKLPQVQERQLLPPKCPCCKTGSMITILYFNRRGPPTQYMGVRQPDISCKS